MIQMQPIPGFNIASSITILFYFYESFSTYQSRGNNIIKVSLHAYSAEYTRTESTDVHVSILLIN